VYFSVGALRASVDRSTLGPPKSASEGAERDRTWPAIVPTRPGRVISVTKQKLIVSMEGDGNAQRTQTYTLNGKHAYVAPGDHFEAETEILAGAPHSLADLTHQLQRVYNPLEEIRSTDPLSRYAAVKALRFRPDLHARRGSSLEKALDVESEGRVALEAAASASALGLAKGQERLSAVLWNNEAPELSMEAILILTELGTPFAREELVRAATRLTDERRQAAIWGLGKSGLRSYGDLVPFISDSEENVAYHAIAAFGSDTPRTVVERLTGILIAGEPRSASAASEALRVIGSAEALACLTQAVTESAGGDINWLLATLGRMPPDMVRDQLRGRPLLKRLEPMLLVANGASWLASEDAVTNIAFLLKQNL
jgi:hypothetical protein